MVGLLILFLAVLRPCLAQTSQPEIRDYSSNPKGFPKIYNFYRQRSLPPPDLNNSKTLSQMILEGKIELSLSQFATVVVENNLNLALDRREYQIAETDILRSKSGGAARGVSGAGANIPDELFSSAIGASVGNLGALGGIGLTGSVSGTGRAFAIPPSGTYDPAVIFNFSWDHTASPLNTLVVAGIPNVGVNTAFYQVGWQQAFTSGTNFRVTLSNQAQDSTQQFLIYNPDVISRLSIAFNQQLMNGFGFAVNRRFLSVTRNNLKITREWFLQQTQTTLAQAEDSYWDLAAAQEAVQAAEAALKTTQKLVEDSRNQAEAGIIASLDVVSSLSQEAANTRDLIVAQTNLQQQSLTLKNFFSRQITKALGEAQLVAADPLPDPGEERIPSLDEALSIAIRNRPELSQAEGILDNDRIAVKVTSNFLKPTFNLFAFFASAGLSGDQSLTNSSGVVTLQRMGLGTEFTQLIEGRYPEYAAGFSLTIPIRNRAALADSARAAVDEKQAETTLQKSKNQIEVEVRNAILGLLQNKEQVMAARKALYYSQQEADAERKKLAIGASTTYNVILADRNLLNAQLVEVQARDGYAKALVEMARATGVLLEKSNVKPEDALRGSI